MTRHVVIGTAGHVDHGKTALVRALTGVDTDRWEEEKRRGITIDLGFAPLDLGGGLAASIVDVPGHEHFVRNMVAGATGVDAALLVVAADEGVMPQTVEHVAILEFLGVATGVVAVSKADLAEPEWLDLVLADVTERLAGSAVRWEPPVLVSAATGAGLDDLRAALARAAERTRARAADDLFRLPVDRVFSVAGAGTVVTGTAWSGAVGVGESVEVLPAGHAARVRSIEVHGEARQRAEPGRRTALALAGLGRDAVARGDVVVAGEGWRATGTLDVLVTLLPGVRPLGQRSRVRLHLGTAEVLARVTPAEREIASGTTGAARLRLEVPTVARWGDRAVLRSYSPVTTIGGCVVVDPWPAARPRRPHAVPARAVSDAVARTVAFVRAGARAGLAPADLPVRVGVRPPEVETVVRAVVAQGIARAGARLVPAGALASAREVVLRAVDAHHRAHPLEPGIPKERVRAVVADAALADQVLAGLAEAGDVVVAGDTVRRPDFRAGVPAAQQVHAEAVRRVLVEAGPHGATGADLEAAAPGAAVVTLAEFFVRQGVAVRVGGGRYYDRVALEQLRDAVLDEVRRLGRATPAELRARTGLTRKYLIPVLEWLDARGFTVRQGDHRALGPVAHRAREPA